MTLSEDSIQPFEVEVAPEKISNLRRRLEKARWPDQLSGAGWDYGTEQRYLRSLCEHWREEFDWLTFKDRFNEFNQYVTTIDDQPLHFYHIRSLEPSARPLLLSHGWPGSVAEFLDIFGPLADPAAHGGDPADAFHVIAPSLPGYGFSGPTRERGYDAERIASTSSLCGFDNIVYKSSNLETACGAVLEGMTFEYVFTPEALEGMFAWNPDRIMEVAACENATILVHDHLPDGDRCGLGIVDDRAGICCHDAETGALVAVIDTDAPEARDWAISVFEQVRAEATAVDPTDFESRTPS